MMITEAVLSKAAKNQWEHTPAFSNFADMSIAGYPFGGLRGLQVQRATLAGSMQVGFTAPS